MNRDSIYLLKDGEGTTFEYDETLPALPLPKLEDTLERYYESLKPFGTEEELKNSREIIENFKNGIGKKLHAALEEIASREKNWIERFWSDYAYFILRIPLQPYTTMAMALNLQSVYIPETKEYSLKSAARCMYHTLEHWDILRKEKLKPASAAGGKIKFSSDLWKKFYSTARIPGDPKDRINSYFKPISEGSTPTHGIIIGKGRIFKFECINGDGSLITPQQILAMLRNIRGILDYEPIGSCVPVLTCDDRSTWAKNRKHLKEISPHNINLLKLIESSAMMLTLDEHEPIDYAESSLMSITGDFHSKWADRTSIIVLYKNGKIACEGEHSAYDGSISVSYAFFILLSLLEKPEPDWNFIPKHFPLPVEVNFQTDDYIKSEIQRVIKDCDDRRHDIIVTYTSFTEFGKDYLKSVKLHPDAFIQMILQLTYYKLHGEFAATYETALMRDYYHGRTETVRSCTVDSVEFVKTAINKNSTKFEIYEKFKLAIQKHNEMMSEARKGNGIDRHLFGLWCIAYENNINDDKDLQLYTDELYKKSGGGGNFVLSTSTLGYTISTGFVAPMILDGYGIFYSITSTSIEIHVSAYRNSQKTSAYKFDKKFTEIMLEMKDIVDNCISITSKM